MMRTRGSGPWRGTASSTPEETTWRRRSGRCPTSTRCCCCAGSPCSRDSIRRTSSGSPTRPRSARSTTARRSSARASSGTSSSSSWTAPCGSSRRPRTAANGRSAGTRPASTSVSWRSCASDLARRPWSRPSRRPRPRHQRGRAQVDPARAPRGGDGDAGHARRPDQHAVGSPDARARRATRPADRHGHLPANGRRRLDGPGAHGRRRLGRPQRHPCRAHPRGHRRPRRRGRSNRGRRDLRRLHGRRSGGRRGDRRATADRRSCLAAARPRSGCGWRLHTGEAHRAGDDYGGFEVNRAARIAGAGHGGQIVLSEADPSAR